MQKLRLVSVVAIGIGFMTIQNLHGEEKTQASEPLTLIHRDTFPATGIRFRLLSKDTSTTSPSTLREKGCLEQRWKTK
jgi:hypothetical protein